jgi:hypothetical protein
MLTASSVALTRLCLLQPWRLWALFWAQPCLLCPLLLLLPLRPLLLLLLRPLLLLLLLL